MGDINGLPLWHQRDSETSVVAAVRTRAGASVLRQALCLHLLGCGREGMTGDEASEFVDQQFPERFVEYAGRRRLSDLCDIKFGDVAGAFARPTRHRRVNRRGNSERVIMHRDFYTNLDHDDTKKAGP